MNKQGIGKIEWCDYTWNPVTGCKHGCRYCYAEEIANRFSMLNNDVTLSETKEIIDMVYGCNESKDYKITGECISLYTPIGCEINEPYPFNFRPTFYHYRLQEPLKKRKPSKIFVVSMGDLFGEWVPDEWIQEVFKACEAAPQHTYMFLTKNGSRYEQLGLLPDNDKFWYGTTRTGINPKLECGAADHGKKFLSLEPLLAPIDTGTLDAIEFWDWVIIGQQTGTGAKPPKPEWVQKIIDRCRDVGVPVFVKSPLYEKFPIQEWPEGLK